MHHLARHSVACFLTRGDLYISWEEGQAVFEEYLIDAVRGTGESRSHMCMHVRAVWWTGRSPLYTFHFICPCYGRH
jgi:hypothetical protein